MALLGGVLTLKYLDPEVFWFKMVWLWNGLIQNGLTLKWLISEFALSKMDLLKKMAWISWLIKFWIMNFQLWNGLTQKWHDSEMAWLWNGLTWKWSSIVMLWLRKGLTLKRLDFEMIKIGNGSPKNGLAQKGLTLKGFTLDWLDLEIFDSEFARFVNLLIENVWLWNFFFFFFNLRNGLLLKWLSS